MLFTLSVLQISVERSSIGYLGINTCYILDVYLKFILQCCASSKYRPLHFVLINARSKTPVSMRKRANFLLLALMEHLPTCTLCIRKRALSQSQQLVMRLTAIPPKDNPDPWKSLAWSQPSIHSLLVLPSPAPEEISFTQIQNTVIQVNHMERGKHLCANFPGRRKGMCEPEVSLEAIMLLIRTQAVSTRVQ